MHPNTKQNGGVLCCGRYFCHELHDGDTVAAEEPMALSSLGLGLEGQWRPSTGTVAQGDESPVPLWHHTEDNSLSQHLWTMIHPPPLRMHQSTVSCEWNRRAAWSGSVWHLSGSCSSWSLGNSDRDLKSDQKDLNCHLNRKRTSAGKHREENRFVLSFPEAEEKLQRSMPGFNLGSLLPLPTFSPFLHCHSCSFHPNGLK